jgi:hypothetical protein
MVRLSSASGANGSLTGSALLLNFSKKREMARPITRVDRLPQDLLIALPLGDALPMIGSFHRNDPGAWDARTISASCAKDQTIRTGPTPKNAVFKFARSIETGHGPRSQTGGSSASLLSLQALG